MVLVTASLSVTLPQAAAFDLETKLIASDINGGDFFGISVAIGGDTALVGAYADADAGINSGAAYLYDGTTGDPIARLTPSDAAREDFFGASVAVSSDGNVALVGATGDDDGGSSSGSAYLFDVATGAQIAKLTANDAASGDLFGGFVAVNNNTALVSASYDDDGGRDSGSAYLFDVTTGAQTAKLNATNANAEDRFGSSVSISGNLALIGALGDDEAASNSGAAYLFDIDPSSTTFGDQLFKLTTSDANVADWFGGSVAISGNLALIGAAGDDDRGRNAGAAYLFDVATGTQIAKFTASDGNDDDWFGFSVAISGNMALIGARWDNDAGDDSGTAYVFDVTTGEQIAKLTASDAAAGDEFGISVAISGNSALVGAYRTGSGINGETGSAYLFNGTVLLGDFNADGIVDAADYTVYRDNLGASSSALNGNGAGATTVVAADFALWVNNFGNSVSNSVALPEPGTLLLLSLGCFGAVGRERRKRPTWGLGIA